MGLQTFVNWVSEKDKAMEWERAFLGTPQHACLETNVFYHSHYILGDLQAYCKFFYAFNVFQTSP